jgi:hypothetical protein
MGRLSKAAAERDYRHVQVLTPAHAAWEDARMRISVVGERKTRLQKFPDQQMLIRAGMGAN